MGLNNSSIFLRTATTIGTEICHNSFWHESSCNWIAVTRGKRNTSELSSSTILKPLGHDIYNGTSGIALFLSTLYQYKNSKIYHEAAQGALNTAISSKEKIDPKIWFSFYSGFVGVVYASMKFSQISKNKEIFDRTIDILLSKSNYLNKEHFLDIISGTASAIPILLKIYEVSKRNQLLELAIQLGDGIISKAVKNSIGWSWDSSSNGIESEKNLTGFSHGSAGIGYSLLKLYEKTGKSEFKQGAEKAFEYENQWFNKEKENWPDFRSDLPKLDSTRYAMAWCHGAPGIGLSRLEAFKILKNKSYLNDLNSALRTSMKILALQKVIGYDFSLCHGLSGVCELLLTAENNDKNYGKICKEIGEFGIREYGGNFKLWPCGTHLGTSPALMLGLAGIGYFYLRLNDPKRVQSILML